MAEIIDLSPSPDIIQSFIQRSSTLKDMLAELIDNAFDQDATWIRVTVIEDGLIVEDNGRGVADLTALLKFGSHSASRSGAIGRYGVGFKHAACWLAESVTIESRHNNVSRFAQVDWNVIQETGRWQILAPDRRPDSGPSFARFTFDGIRGRRLRNLETAAKDLAYRFTPGLKAGATIIIDGESLRPVELPAFDGDILTIDDIYLDGQHYKLTAGVKASNGDHQRCGYDVAYAHRVIIQRDLSGFDTYSAQRFYGWLELLNDGEDWTLAEHKDDFAERDDLYADLLDEVRPLLERAAQTADEMHFKDCQQVLNSRMARLATGDNPTKNAREKRNKGSSNGTRTPTDTGRKRRNAKQYDEDNEGSVAARLGRQANGIRVTFDHHAPDRIGEVQSGSGTIIVSLNPAFDLVRERNTDVLTVIVCALLVLDGDWGPRNRQQFLPGLEPESHRPGAADFSTLLIKALGIPAGDDMQIELTHG